MFGGREIEIIEIAPSDDAAGVLPGSDFIDAYSVSIGRSAARDARAAALRMMSDRPAWIGALMTLRNILVAPFGLVTDTSEARDRVGIFPVLEQSADRIVLGLDDKHLDFRVIVELRETSMERSVVATTLVSTHNLLGRVYLAMILPFHRVIVKAMLARVP